MARDNSLDFALSLASSSVEKVQGIEIQILNEKGKKL